jgi:hypothetical protein
MLRCSLCELTNDQFRQFLFNILDDAQNKVNILGTYIYGFDHEIYGFTMDMLVSKEIPSGLLSVGIIIVLYF